MAKKVILRTNIKRSKDKLYVCGSSEEGYVTIIECDRKSSKQKIISKDIEDIGDLHLGEFSNKKTKQKLEVETDEAEGFDEVDFE